MQSMLTAASNYAERGWPVFPCDPKSKRPLTEHGFKDASRVASQVTRWWTEWPDALIGVPTGPVTNFWVVDVDDPEEFEKAWARPHPKTRRSRTGKGCHLFFAWDPENPMRNSQRSRAGWPFPGLPGVEVRGEGGYVIVPPSKHPSGAEYRWDDDGEIVAAPEELLALLKRSDRALKAVHTQVSTNEAAGSLPRANAIEALRTECEAIRSAPHGGQEKSLNDAALRLGKFVARGELALEAATKELIEAGLDLINFDPSHPWTRKQIEAKVERGLRDGMQKCDRRHVIMVRPGQVHEMATEAEISLIEGGAPFYIRAGAIVLPMVEGVPTARGEIVRVARVLPADVDMIFDHISRTSRWIRYSSRHGRDVQVSPPREVAKTILSRAGEWRFPKLAGVITTPTLRPDGTILARPGYDEATRLLLIDPPSIPTIPASPDRNDALAALCELESLIDGFPFKDEPSRSVAISGLICPVIRGAMSVVPLHAVTAPVAGSGKSYFVDLVSAIATGDRAAVIAAGRTEEETEKRLVAALLGGQPIISIDNVNGDLGGDLLCQMIERPALIVRPLGRSDAIRIESRVTSFATGNNIRLVGDMSRRTIVCALDPQLEQPELRVFDGNPFQKIIRDRGRYVAAALTIVRAYIVAGYPGELAPLASFEDWSRLVRSALVWLGRADPLKSIERARFEDPVLAQLRTVLPALHELTEQGAMAAGAIKAALLNYEVDEQVIEILANVAGGRNGEIDTARLGRYFGASEGRIVEGLKLTSIYQSHTKQKAWRVMRV